MVLLIARILEKKQIEEYLTCAQELGMEVLLELADISETGKIPDKLSNVILGINNRNLNNFEIRLDTSLEIKNHLPDKIPVISESGIRNGNDCRLLSDHGFSGVLIGETLMKSDNPKQALREMKKAVLS